MLLLHITLFPLQITKYLFQIPSSISAIMAKTTPKPLIQEKEDRNNKTEPSVTTAACKLTTPIEYPGFGESSIDLSCKKLPT